MSRNIPIIVGFPIENETLDIVKQLNVDCTRSKGIDFEKVIPHVTLWMGFVSEEDLRFVFDDFYHVFKSVYLELTFDKQEIYSGVNGDVLSLGLICSRSLSTLQNRIHHFWEPYRNKCDDFENFSIETISYINNFESCSLDNYDPHITVGFKSTLSEVSMGNVKVENPKIFLMGNNCTCLEVIAV